MKLHEAVAALQKYPEYWIRPVGWRHGTKAYTLKDGMCSMVPFDDGPRYGMTPHPYDLTGDWELVDPEDVIGGK